MREACHMVRHDFHTMFIIVQRSLDVFINSIMIFTCQVCSDLQHCLNKRRCVFLSITKRARCFSGLGYTDRWSVFAESCSGHCVQDKLEKGQPAVRRPMVRMQAATRPPTLWGYSCLGCYLIEHLFFENLYVASPEDLVPTRTSQHLRVGSALMNQKGGRSEMDLCQWHLS